MEDLGKKYQNKIGVILTNLGTPKSPLRKDVKKYLNQFLLYAFFQSILPLLHNDL